ncbi:MAG: DNA-3-methyladenine glycosylase [Terracoccus sp.]
MQTGDTSGEGELLGRHFFARPVLAVSRDLLGCHLTHGGVTVRITETEAYAGHLDPGSHAYRGETPRTRPMFGPPGFTYAYFTYGNHWMLCLVTGAVGEAEAVLVRAGEVVGGEDLVRRRRSRVTRRDWTRGPGRLAQALALTGADTGRDFCHPPLGEPIDLTVTAGVGPDVVRVGPRVGVSGPGGDGEAFPWRFWAEGEPSVSTYRPGAVRRRAADPT